MNDNANINMASSRAVNDNEWHVFFGERYACYVANPNYSPSSFASEWAATDEANRGTGLTCSRNGAEDGRLSIDGTVVDEDHGTGGASGVDTTMPVFIGGHPDVLNGNWDGGTLGWGLGSGDVTLANLDTSVGQTTRSSCGISCGHDALQNYAGCLTDLNFQITSELQQRSVTTLSSDADRCYHQPIVVALTCATRTAGRGWTQPLEMGR